jgi:hypothetical protein
VAADWSEASVLPGRGGESSEEICTMEEALAGIEAIDRDYLCHCESALALARKYLDSDRVLPSILDTCQSACCV